MRSSAETWTEEGTSSGGEDSPFCRQDDSDSDGSVEVQTPSDSRRKAVARAAFLIQQAADGVARAGIRETSSARRAFILRFETLPFVRACTWLLVSMTFFEQPQWCTRPDMAHLGDKPCGNPMYPSYPIPYMSENMGIVVEILLTTPIAADMALIIFAQGHLGGHVRTRLVLLVVLLCDMVYAYFAPIHFFRFAPCLRIAVAIQYSHSTRNRLKLLVRTLPGVLTTSVFALIYIVFFAWIGVIFFPMDGAEGRSFFPGLLAGMWSLLVLLTTANFPDVMMPAYSENREVFLYFGFFVIVGIYFLVNVTTAVAFNVYQECREHDAEWFKLFQATTIKAAYDVLSTKHDGISTETLKELFDELNHYEDIQYITSDNADILASSLDEDNDGTCTEAEFGRIMAALTLAMVENHPPPFVERYCHTLAATRGWQVLKDLVLRKWVEIGMDVFLVIIFVSNVFQTWGDIVGHEPDNSAKDLSWKPIQAIIAWVFLVDCVLHILVLGWSRYWSESKHKFDFVVTVMAVVVAIYVWIPSTQQDPRLVRTVATLRVLRLLRLLDRFHGFAVIFGTFLNTLPHAFAMARVLFCAMYVFSVLGTQIFGGVINTDPRSPYSGPVAASDFAKAGYYPNNFNDMPSAMVVLFELLVVNNWFVLVDGYTAALGAWARVYFVTWYIFGVLICLNVVVAFVIETFLSEYQKHASATTTTSP
mmetsp:Transcript_60952/g.199560  ORF Transcript_60952/g.199560 Transcript_60952/m.199560 type:complete len:704 (+) Transcript_60952:68-2179(+)